MEGGEARGKGLQREVTTQGHTGPGTLNLGLQLCLGHSPQTGESLKQGSSGAVGEPGQILGPFLLQVRLRGPVGSAAVSPMNKFLDSFGGRVGGQTSRIQ